MISNVTSAPPSRRGLRPSLGNLRPRLHLAYARFASVRLVTTSLVAHSLAHSLSPQHSFFPALTSWAARPPSRPTRRTAASPTIAPRSAAPLAPTAAARLSPACRCARSAAASARCRGAAGARATRRAASRIRATGRAGASAARRASSAASRPRAPPTPPGAAPRLENADGAACSARSRTCEGAFVDRDMGPRGSGKSTLIRQLKLAHDGGMSSRALHRE